MNWKSCSFLAVAVMALLYASGAQAAELTISLGMRETGGDTAGGDAGTGGPALGNAGFSGGIEWVNKDGQTLTADGTWQKFTFTPSVDALSAFAGGTANGALEAGAEWASIEHIRILNSDGIEGEITLWIDDVSVNEAAGSTVEGFESFSVGDEVMFQEPSFSGSTGGNLLGGSTAGVTDGMAFTGDQSYRADFQFVDNTATRWLRYTTFQTPNVPNPWLRTVEPGAAPPTLTFWAKATVIPEPSTLLLGLVGGIGLLATRRRLTK